MLFIRRLCGQQQAPAGHVPIVLNNARHGVPLWLRQNSQHVNDAAPDFFQHAASTMGLGP